MCKRLGLFTVIFVLMFSAIPFTLAENNCDYSYSNHARGAQLHAMGDLTSALSHYECALAQNPDSDILILSIGNIYRDMGDMTTAQTYYDQIPHPILNIDNDNLTCDPTVAHHARGAELISQNHLWFALYHFECALIDNPNSDSLLTSIGNIYRDFGDMTTAQTYYDRISNDKKATVSNDRPTCETGISHHARGAQLYSMKDLWLALYHYECALEENPDSDILLLSIGNIYRDMGELEASKAYYNRSDIKPKSVQNDCDTSISQFAEGSQLHAMGDLSRALESYHCVLLQHPDHTAVMIQIAQVYTEIDNYNAALVYLNRALQVDDQNAAIYQQRGYVHYLNGDLEAALLDLNVALEINPNLSTAQELREQILKALGQVEVVSVESPASKNALPQLDTTDTYPTTMMVAEVAPSSASVETVRQAAENLFNSYEYEAAISQYQALLAYEPDNAFAHYRIGYAYYALEHPSQGLTYLQQAYDLNPDHLYTRYLLAMTYSMLDNNYQAFDLMNSIHQNHANDGAFPIAMGHVYRNLGYNEAAANEFYTWIHRQQLIHIEAPSITDNSPTTFVMDYGVVYEVPFYGVAGSAIQIHAASSIFNSTPVDPLIVVLDKHNNPIAGDDDSGGLFDSLLTFIPPSTGEYKLLITHAGGNSAGELNVRIAGGAWSAETYRTLAQFAMDDQNYQRAIEMIGKAIMLDGSNVQDHLLLARAYTGLQDYPNAILAYHAALELATNPADIYERLGHLYGLMEDWDSAAIAYSQALEHNPHLNTARCKLGIIYAMWGNYDDAIRQFDIVLSYDQTDSCAWSNRRSTLRVVRETETIVSAAPAQPSPADDLVRLGFEARDEGKRFSAAFYFIEALTLDPSLDQVRCELGLIYSEWGHHLAAIEYYNQVQSDPCAETNREITNRMRGNFQTSQQNMIYMSAAPAQPSPADDLVALGYQLLEQGHEYSAAHTFRDALRIDPSLDTVRCELAQIYMGWGNYVGATSELRQVTSHPCAEQQFNTMEQKLSKIYVPMTADDFVTMAQAHKANEEWDEALDDYLKALELEPTNRDVRCQVGILYVMQEKYQEAWAQFDLILVQEMGHSCAWANLEALRQTMRESDLSASDVSASTGVSEISPMTAGDFVKMAQAHKAREEWDEALDDYLIALELEPSNRDVRCQVGILYVMQEKYQEAWAQFDLILVQEMGHSCAWTNLEALRQTMRESDTSASTGVSEISPMTADDYVAQAKQQYTRGQLDAAIESMSLALELEPNRADLRCKLGMFYVESGDYHSGLQQFDRILNNDSTNACAWSNRNGLMQQLRQTYGGVDINQMQAYSDEFLAQDVYDYPMPGETLDGFSTPHSSQPEIFELDALYRELIAHQDMTKLINKTGLYYDNAYALLLIDRIDRYINEHFAFTCANELQSLADSYRERGHDIIADLLHLKAISNSTC